MTSSIPERFRHRFRGVTEVTQPPDDFAILVQGCDSSWDPWMLSVRSWAWKASPRTQNAHSEFGKPTLGYPPLVHSSDDNRISSPYYNTKMPLEIDQKGCKSMIIDTGSSVSTCSTLGYQITFGVNRYSSWKKGSVIPQCELLNWINSASTRRIIPTSWVVEGNNEPSNSEQH